MKKICLWCPRALSLARKTGLCEEWKGVQEAWVSKLENLFLRNQRLALFLTAARKVSVFNKLFSPFGIPLICFKIMVMILRDVPHKMPGTGWLDADCSYFHVQEASRTLCLACAQGYTAPWIIRMSFTAAKCSDTFISHLSLPDFPGSRMRGFEGWYKY